MHARLVLPDATTRAVALPPGPAPVSIIAALVSAETVVVQFIQLVRPGPDDPETGMWLVSAPAEGLALNPAAAAIAAFWSAAHAGQEIFGPVLVTSGPDALHRLRPLTKDHDEIVTTIASQIRTSQHGGTQHGPEVS